MDDDLLFTFSTVLASWAMFVVLFWLSWWWLLVPVVLVVLIGLGYAVIALVVHISRIKRERDYEAKKRRKQTYAGYEAIRLRADKQNEYLHLGMIRDVEIMKHLGVYGDYPPVELEWPEAVA